MRSLRLAAAAILAGSMAVAVLAGSALAAPANLAAGFPATRIKLESPSTPVGMPGADTLTATIVDWRGAPLAHVAVDFTNVADPPKPFQPGSPRATPKPSARATPTPAPAPVTYTINVDGVNFNPYSAVLVTFDVGPGGTPQSFERTTDVFGHFNFDIQVRSRSEGVHLV